MASVLVVDPNLRARAVTVSALSSLGGVSVIAASGVDEARAILRTMRPHLVIAEFGVGDSAGLDVLAALHELLPEVPVVLTTGPETQVTMTRAKVSTLTRPFTADRLRDVVSENLTFDAFWDALVAPPSAPASSPFTQHLSDAAPRETIPFGAPGEAPLFIDIPKQSDVSPIVLEEPGAPTDASWGVDKEFEALYRSGVEALLDRRHRDAYEAFVAASKLGCSASLLANLERLRGLGFGV